MCFITYLTGQLVRHKMDDFGLMGLINFFNNGNHTFNLRNTGGVDNQVLQLTTVSIDHKLNTTLLLV